MVWVKFLRRNRAWKSQRRHVAKVRNANGCTGSALQGGCGPLVHSQMHLNKMQAETKLPRRSSSVQQDGGVEREGGGVERSDGVEKGAEKVAY